jgi:hypothetical protein
MRNAQTVAAELCNLPTAGQLNRLLGPPLAPSWSATSHPGVPGGPNYTEPQCAILGSGAALRLEVSAVANDTLEHQLMDRIRRANCERIPSAPSPAPVATYECKIARANTVTRGPELVATIVGGRTNVVAAWQGVVPNGRLPADADSKLAQLYALVQTEARHYGSSTYRSLTRSP